MPSIAGSRVDLVKSGIAIAVRAGAPTPQLADEESVKNAVLAARTLGVSTGPSGVYLESLFDCSVGCNDPEAAARLLAFLASPAVTEVKSRHGMEAAGSPA